MAVVAYRGGQLYCMCTTESSFLIVPKKGLIGNVIFFRFFSDFEISFFLQILRFSIESDSKNSFSRSRSIGPDPGILEIL